jgi:pantothenate kinase type III
MRRFVLLLDVGNTHTHLGLADANAVLKQTDIPTSNWAQTKAAMRV